MNRFVSYLILWLWCVCLAANGQPATKPTARPRENRFLFIVETSAATKRIAESSQRIVVQLLSDEIAGQMKPGDSFSIWTYNETLNAGRFPAQRWNPEARRATLQQVTNFLGTVKFEKNGRLEVVRPAIEGVTRSSPKLTLILVTDGKQAVAGLKFDEEINQLFKDNYTAMREAKMPFVTIVVARSGEFVAYSVNSTLGPIKYPPPPPSADSPLETGRTQPNASEAQKPPSEIAVGNEPTPAVVSKPAPAAAVPAPAPTKPASAPPPTIQSDATTHVSPEPKPVSPVPTPAAPPKANEALPSAAGQTAPPPIDAPTAKPRSSEPPAQSPPLVAIGTGGKNVPEQKTPEAAPPKTGAATDPSKIASATNEASNTSKVAPAKLPQPTIAVINPVETTTGRRSLLGTALGLLLVAVFLGYLLLRPKRDSSLITKSIHRLPK